MIDNCLFKVLEGIYELDSIVPYIQFVCIFPSSGLGMWRQDLRLC